MILLDTNALIWMALGHPRARPLAREARRPYLSPASILELQFLQESGRVVHLTAVSAVTHDDRWVLDEPSSAAWFVEATTVGWTRDPFDRLLVAHAQLRGWRLATADAAILRQLGPNASLEL